MSHVYKLSKHSFFFFLSTVETLIRMICNIHLTTARVLPNSSVFINGKAFENLNVIYIIILRHSAYTLNKLSGQIQSVLDRYYF